MAAARTYRALTQARGVSLAFRQRLWLAADHLLLVRSFGFSEDYRRVFFADLQALRIQPTSGRLVWNLVWVTLALLGALPLLGISDPAGRVMLGIWTAFFALAALINTALGARCRFWLHTPAGEVRVACVTRVGKALAIADRIRPLIRQAQQPLTAEERQALPEAAAHPEPRPAVTAAAPAAPPRVPARAATPRDLQVVTWALVVPILFGSLELVLLGVNNLLLTLLELVTALAFGVMMVVAIVRQRGRPLGTALLVLCWCGVGVFVLMLLAAQGHQVIAALEAGQQTPSPFEQLRRQASLTGRSSPFIFYINSFVGAATLALGLAGLLLIRRRMNAAPPAALPPALPGVENQ